MSQVFWCCFLRLGHVRRYGRLALKMMVIGVLLAGCASEVEKPAATPTLPAAEQGYDADSWRSTIPLSCEHYSDGCNLCNRNPESGLTACTRKACFTYQRPECLDESRVKEEASGPTTLVYHCSGDERFVVAAGEYMAGGQRLTLADHQLMLTDRQTGKATLMTRVSNASGARYKGDDLELWSKGKEAMLLRGGTPLYWNCAHP
jgi:membrane-bound inhibitor of C-type lysozyme